MRASPIRVLRSTYTELFSRHADSNVAGGGMPTFAKEQARFMPSNIPKELRATVKSTVHE